MNPLSESLPLYFASAFCATVAYLILSSICECFRECLHQRISRRNAPQNTVAVISEPADPTCLAQLHAIPVLIYVDQPSCSSTSAEMESCSVCLVEYVSGDEVRVLPRCTHMFHKDCIDRWLITRSSFCPICRDRVIDRSVEPGQVNSSINDNNGGSSRRDGFEYTQSLQVHLEINVVPPPPLSGNGFVV